MKILDRYLLKQVTGPFLFGVVAFVLLFISANVLLELAELMSQLGLGIWVAIELFALRLPGFIVLTFPLATLVAILIVFGRMSGDSELVAMSAGGVSFRRLVAPLLVFGLLVSLVTVGLNELVAPTTERRADEIVAEATLRAGGVHQQDVMERDVVGGTGRVIYASRLDLQTREMISPIILWIENGKLVTVTTAERARWRGSDWQLINGENKVFGAARPTSVAFAVWDAHFPTSPEQLASGARDPEKRTYRELQRDIAHALRQERPVAELSLALYHRLSLPFASLVFALLAPALGMRSHRGSTSLGMGLAILIGFAYYVVYNYLTVAARLGGFPPFWAAWLPNLITAVVGATLVLRVKR